MYYSGCAGDPCGEDGRGGHVATLPKTSSRSRANSGRDASAKTATSATHAAATAAARAQGASHPPSPGTCAAAGRDEDTGAHGAVPARGAGADAGRLRRGGGGAERHRRRRDGGHGDRRGRDHGNGSGEQEVSEQYPLAPLRPLPPASLKSAF